MNVSLTVELEQFVSERVESGNYGSASEVVREALRLLRQSEEVRELRLQELKLEIRRGLDQLEAGQAVPLDAAAIKAKARRQAAGSR